MICPSTPARLSFVNPSGSFVAYRNLIVGYTVSGGESEEESESLGTNILGQPIKLITVANPDADTQKLFTNWALELLLFPEQLQVFKAMVADEQNKIWAYNTKAEPGDRSIGESHSVKLVSWSYSPEGKYWKLSLTITNDVAEPAATCGFSMSLQGVGQALNIPCSRITEWNRAKAEWFALERSIFGKQLLKTSIYRYPYLWQIGFVATSAESLNLRTIERSHEEEIIERNVATGASSGLEWLNFTDSVEPDVYVCVGSMSNLNVKPIKSGAYQITLSFTEVFD